MSREPESVKKLRASIKKARGVTAPENSVGQWIGYCLWNGAHSIFESTLHDFNESNKTKFRLKPLEDDKQVKLPDSDGTLKQIDHAFFDGETPIVIAESKWLKDQRHLNDKGSWLKLMREIVGSTPSILESILILAGPWDSYRAQMEGRGFKVVITDVSTVYQALKKHGVTIKINEQRNAFENPKQTLESFLDVVETSLDQGDQNPLATIGLSMLHGNKSVVEKTVKEALAKAI